MRARPSAAPIQGDEVHIQINGAKICNCLVKNLSETGAKLLVPGGCWIPSAFDIIGLIDDLPVKARRVWNSDGEMGVSFIRGE